MDFSFKVLVIIGLFVAVTSVTTSAAVIDVKDSTDIDEDSKVEIAETKDNVTACHLRQTMAWSECHHIDCPVTCQGFDDCTFPYCDSLGHCACRQASCQSAKTCSFFRISCTGQFTCNEGSCFCEK